MSRGFRNCNPGNIRRSAVRYRGEIEGCDPEFRTFAGMEWGMRAIFVVLHTYAVRYGCLTLRSMLARYAPASENPAENYLHFVAAESGVGADAAIDTLDGEVMMRIAEAIVRFENGLPADRTVVVRGWSLFAEDFVR